MQDTEYRKWDIRVKLITTMLTITSIFLGLYQFNTSQTNNIKLEHQLIKTRDSIETVNKMWEQKINVYTEVGTAIGNILANIGKDSTDKYIRDYLILYYGKSILVQDTTVQNKMNNFRLEILLYNKGYATEGDIKEKGRLLGEAIRDNIEIKRKYLQ